MTDDLEQRADMLIGRNTSGEMSLKQLAMAYGTARKGSDEERQLLAVLVERIQGGGE